MAYKAMTVAKYIINKCTEENRPISNLQLQKILYFIQRNSLKRGFAAFDDPIEAWKFGPVVPDVYYMFCGYGSMDIVHSFPDTIEGPIRDVVDTIVEIKREMEPWELVRETHAKGKAWELTYKDGEGDHRRITPQLIKQKG